MSNFTAHEKLQIARIHLQKMAPFYAYLSYKLKLVENEAVGTAGVDAHGNMYYSPTWIGQGKSTANLVFLWAHEIGHIIFDHVFRVGDKNKEIWNMACDYVINGIAIKEGVGEFIQGGLHDTKYDGMTAQQVYNILMEDAKANADRYQKTKDDGLADDHGNWGDGGSEMSEEEAQAISSEWKSAVISAAHAAKAAGGEVPEAFRGLINDLTNTKIRWYDYVRNKIKSCNKEESSWSRINRRRKIGDFNMPGKKPGEEVEFYVAIDVSGSFSQGDVTASLTEVYGACREFEKVKIHVFQWDTRIYNYQVFEKHNANEMYQYKIKGGGGTDFNCVNNWLINSNKKPTQMFVFTDLEFSYMPDPHICPTTFIVVGSNKSVPPYGDCVEYSKF